MNSIAILTICRNDLSSLKRTVASVLEQTYQPAEFIVVDGGSTDGTQEYLAENSQAFSRWISEADEGISDAFNKAFGLATSEWIIFLNAGDVFASPVILSSISNRLTEVAPEVAALCGNIDLLDGSKRKQAEINSNIENISTSCCIAHQGSFIRRRIQEQYPYDKRLRTGMDYDFWLRVLKSHKIAFAPVKIANCNWGGISTSKSWQEHQLIFDGIIRILNSGKRTTVVDLLRISRRVLAFRMKTHFRSIAGDQVYKAVKRLASGRQKNDK